MPKAGPARSSHQAAHGLQPSEPETPLGQGWHRPLGVSCSIASHPMGTPQEKLLLKPSPNLLQLVALISHPAGLRCREGPGLLSRASCGCWGLQRPSLLQATPSPPLPPHGASAPAPLLRVLPSTLQLVHIFPVPGDKTRCSIWMWSDRSHTDRDDPFP